MDLIQFTSVLLSVAYLSAPVAWKGCYVTLELSNC